MVSSRSRTGRTWPNGSGRLAPGTWTRSPTRPAGKTRPAALAAGTASRTDQPALSAHGRPAELGGNICPMPPRVQMRRADQGHQVLQLQIVIYGTAVSRRPDDAGDRQVHGDVVACRGRSRGTQGRSRLKQGLEAGQNGGPPFGDGRQHGAARREAVMGHCELDGTVADVLDVEGDLGSGFGAPGRG